MRNSDLAANITTSFAVSARREGDRVRLSTLGRLLAFETTKPIAIFTARYVKHTNCVFFALSESGLSRQCSKYAVAIYYHLIKGDQRERSR